MERANLSHHLFINGESACRVDQKNVAECRLGVLERTVNDVNRTLIHCRGLKACADLVGEGFKLFDGRWTIHISANDSDLFLFSLHEIASQFGDRGRFTGTL